MAETKKEWGFLAPTRAKAKEMEKKYKGYHFTPLIDYMQVIFPDIDDWKEEEKLNIKGLDIAVQFSSATGKKTVIMLTENGFNVTPNPLSDKSVYCIDYATQLTNATVKHIFGVDVSEPLFDENTHTITQPWIEPPSGMFMNAEIALEGKYVGDEKQYQVNLAAYRAKYDNMGLSEIIVEKLFGLFSYTIDLNADKNISILIGPNGCGKTTILKIVRFMLTGNGDIKEVIKIPFKSITCKLTNGREVKLKSSKNKLNAFIDNKKVAIFYADEKCYYEDAEFASLARANGKENHEDSELCIKKIKDLQKENGSEELDVSEFEETTRKDLKEFIKKQKKQQEGFTLADFLAKGIFETNLKKYGCYFDIEFISAQRLLSRVYDVNEKKTNTQHYLNNVTKIKDDFEAFYAYLGSKYNAKQSKQTRGGGKITEADIKLKLFQKIVNEKFKITQKQLQCQKGKMCLTVGNGRGKNEIPLEVLSSGEKNIFIMYYNLIFKCQDCLVFIDEPEISLHIEWQERYIGDLYKICTMNHIQALIATHSPNIINDRTDLIAKWKVKHEY